jgi:hypothetical protein
LLLYFAVWFLFISPFQIWREQKELIDSDAQENLDEKIKNLSPVALEIYKEVSTLEARVYMTSEKITNEMISSLRDKKTTLGSIQLSSLMENAISFVEHRNQIRSAWSIGQFNVDNEGIKKIEALNVVTNEFNRYILTYCRAIKEYLLGESDFEYVDNLEFCFGRFERVNRGVTITLSEYGIGQVMQQREWQNRNDDT